MVLKGPGPLLPEPNVRSKRIISFSQNMVYSRKYVAHFVLRLFLNFYRFSSHTAISGTVLISVYTVSRSPFKGNKILLFLISLLTWVNYGYALVTFEGPYNINERQAMTSYMT